MECVEMRGDLECVEIGGDLGCVEMEGIECTEMEEAWEHIREFIFIFNYY